MDNVNRIRDLVDCMRVRSLLQSYLDGELDDERGAAMVARHLEACHRCGMAADSLKALKRRLSRLRHEPDPEQVQRIEHLVDQLTTRHSGGSGR